jgi:adenylate cyclase
MDDVFAIQSEIASSITDQLKVKLTGADKQKHDKDIDAYTMYMKATQLFYSSGEASLRQAMELLENAIANDPKFVRAIAGLSTAWFLMASYHYEDWEESLKKAELFARKAIELGPDCDEAHAALAQVFNSYDKFEEAVSEAWKAIQINPNESDAHFLLGLNDFFILGRQETGLKELERGRELDPLSAGMAYMLAQAYDLTGMGTEAINLLLKLRDIDPKNVVIYEALAKHYLMKREFQSAKETLEAGMKIEPENIVLQISQGILSALTGDKENALGILNSLHNAKDETNRLYAALYIGAALKESDRAFGALMRLAETHAWPIEVSPSFA